MNNSIERAGGPWSHCALGKHPSAGVGVLDLKLDELIAGEETTTPEVIQRLQVTAANEGSGQVAAENWLRELGLGQYPERIILPNEERAMHLTTVPVVEGEEELLRVYPNPASPKEPVYVVARLLDGMVQAQLRVMDEMGRLVKEEAITGRMGLIELNTHALPSGSYIAGLFSDGLQLGTAKFQVIR